MRESQPSDITDPEHDIDEPEDPFGGHPPPDVLPPDVDDAAPGIEDPGEEDLVDDDTEDPALPEDLDPDLEMPPGDTEPEPDLEPSDPAEGDPIESDDGVANEIPAFDMEIAPMVPDGAIGAGTPDEASPSPSAPGVSSPSEDQDPAAAPNCDEVSCQAEAAVAASAFGEPQMVPEQFDSAQCTSGGDAGTGDCICARVTGDVALSSAVPEACSVVGRLGECLYSVAEYPGCAPDTDECSQVCAEVWAREIADAERTLEVGVQSSWCGETSNDCGYVLVVEAQCLLGPALTAVDCSLSPEELSAGGAPVP
jgi:hypothetical protein